MIESLIQDSLREYEWNKSCEIKARIRDYEEELFSEFSTIPNFSERISESCSYKHFEPDILTEKIRSQVRSARVEFSYYVLPKVIADELCSDGFDPEKKIAI